MSVQDSDISWQMLRRIVHDWMGTSAELAEVKPLSGGSINTTLALTTQDGGRAVLKVSPHRVDRAYVVEAYQLNFLRQLGLPTPQVYECTLGSLDDPVSYLLMEHMPGVQLNEAREQCDGGQFDHLQVHLAELVAGMHAVEHIGYARVQPDAEEPCKSWPVFYRQCFDPVCDIIEKDEHLPVKVRRQIGKIHEKLERLLAHEDCPRLTHWDLWSSNVLAAPDEHGKWWVTCLLDPYAKYAHAEAEIAYLELFNTVTPAFLRAYQQRRKLPPEYQRLRKHIYQMYPLIAHVTSFGPEYVKPLLATMERLAAVV